LKVKLKSSPVALELEFQTPVVDVDVCVPELTVHRMVSPTLMVTLADSNPKLTMLTLTVLVSSAVVVGAGEVVDVASVVDVAWVVAVIDVVDVDDMETVVV
jgi:hypothetical protein